MRSRYKKDFRSDDLHLTNEEQSPNSNKQNENMFPFSGQLINGAQASNWLIESLSKTDQSCDLCTAFLRSDALRALMPKDRSHFQGRVLVRWQLGDLQRGASDLDSYLTAKELGFNFFIRQDFHGKVFSVPNIGAVVGSANATLSGFGMKESANSEVCTLVPTLESNSIFINNLFDGAIEVNDDLFQEISKVIKNILPDSDEYITWPTELLSKLQTTQSVSSFFTSECLVSIPEMNQNLMCCVKDEKDQKLLGLLDVSASRPTITTVFKRLKEHRWLIEILTHADGELYFGSVASALHDALLDDPTVYRKDVKVLLQTLLSWYELFPELGIVVDRPNYSQRIRLR